MSADRQPAGARDRPHLWLVNGALPTALLVGFVATAAQHLPSRRLVLLCVCMLAGAFLWKVPPSEIGPPPGLHNGYLSALRLRARSAALHVAAWGGIGAAFGALIGAFAALIDNESVADKAGVVCTWGTLLAAAAGVVSWTAIRLAEDVRILRSRQTGVVPDA